MCQVQSVILISLPVEWCRLWNRTHLFLCTLSFILYVGEVVDVFKGIGSNINNDYGNNRRKQTQSFLERFYNWIKIVADSFINEWQLCWKSISSVLYIDFCVRNRMDLMLALFGANLVLSKWIYWIFQWWRKPILQLGLSFSFQLCGWSLKIRGCHINNLNRMKMCVGRMIY